MQPRHVIGIVGGMGPAAGADLFDKIVCHTRGRSDHEHLPVILMSYPAEIPDRTEFLLNGIGENPADAIYTIVRDLEAAGATVAGIPCNTAHASAIFDSVRFQLGESGASIELYDMIAETVRHVGQTQPRAAQIGVLSTQGVRHLRIYADRLGRHGFEVLQSDQDVQDRLVTTAIYSRDYGLKAVSPATDQARRNVLEGIEHLKARGATAVVLGCTELPLAVPERKIDGVALIDPAAVLARALIANTYPDRLSV